MTNALEYFSTHLPSNSIDKQWHVLVNTVFTFIGTWKISFWKVPELKICFQKMAFGGFEGQSKEKQRKRPKFGVLTFATKDLSGETLLFFLGLAQTTCKMHFKCKISGFRDARKPFFFCTVKLENSLFSFVSHPYWHQYGKNMHVFPSPPPFLV